MRPAGIRSPPTTPTCLIVPIPQSSPTLGAGVTLVGALFSNPVKEPSPWVTGIGIMRTTNGSKAVAGLHRMSLGDDKFRLVLFGGHAQINVNFYGIGPSAGERDVAIELEEKGYLAIAQGQYRIAPHLYAGVRSVFLDLNTGIHNPEPRFPELEIPKHRIPDPARHAWGRHSPGIAATICSRRAVASWSPRRGCSAARGSAATSATTS